jgi:hypothetical protein
MMEIGFQLLPNQDAARGGRTESSRPVANLICSSLLSVTTEINLHRARPAAAHHVAVHLRLSLQS